MKFNFSEVNSEKVKAFLIGDMLAIVRGACGAIVIVVGNGHGDTS